MSGLNIVMVSSECAPFARTGGLGDVVGALPQALTRLGHQVKVILPGYSSIDRAGFGFEQVGQPLSVRLADRKESFILERTQIKNSKVGYYLLSCDGLFDRESFYVDPDTGEDYVDNDLRFAMFSKATLEIANKLNWPVDIWHVHDWQAALLPIYLSVSDKTNWSAVPPATVLTIHNLGYQGRFPGDRFKVLDLPGEMFYAASGALEFYNEVSFLKGGIVSSGLVNTVSPRYADEIQTGEEFGCGLEGILRYRRADLSGILNGVDYTEWSPSRDNKIPHKYSVANLSGKRSSRVELLKKAGLPVREGTPLVGFIGRLTDQKGIDLITAKPSTLFDLNLQLVLLGDGPEEVRQAVRKLESAYPDQVRVFLEFNDSLAHTIQAGSDILLMPSKYEPCGLNQMYALKYGTVPVVRQVGGLADTVHEYDKTSGSGNGFVFGPYNSEAMISALERAISLFSRKRAWMKLMKIGMRQDFSWQRSARSYEQLYNRALQKARAAVPDN